MTKSPSWGTPSTPYLDIHRRERPARLMTHQSGRDNLVDERTRKLAASARLLGLIEGVRDGFMPVRRPGSSGASELGLRRHAGREPVGGRASARGGLPPPRTGPAGPSYTGVPPAVRRRLLAGGEGLLQPPCQRPSRAADIWRCAARCQRPQAGPKWCSGRARGATAGSSRRLWSGLPCYLLANQGALAPCRGPARTPETAGGG
jgi:hypothetical protein